MWHRGDQIVLRYRLPVGTDGLPVPRSLRYEDLAGRRWRLGDGVWRDHSVLWLVCPGAAHAIGVFWRDEARAFVGWYGNLQAPLVRTAVGFDSADHALDIDITPVAPGAGGRHRDLDVTPLAHGHLRHGSRCRPGDAGAPPLAGG